MTTDMEIAYGDVLDIAVAKGVERLDIASDTWAERVDPGSMLMEFTEDCLLAQVFGSYKAGLDFLGIDRGEGFGFDIPDDIYDTYAQYEAYEMLAERWEAVIDIRT